VLFGEHGADQADQGVAVGEDAAHDVGASPDLAVEPLLGVVRPHLTPELAREDRERQHVSAGGIQVRGDLRELALEGVEDPTSPRWASEVTSATPERPRAIRSRKNASHPAPSSALETCKPSSSRCLSAFDAHGD
jgi:hypothetical protein